jgi:hypothetical protein
MRKCKQCKAVELPSVAKCTSILEKKGYCSVECLADHTKEKRIVAEQKKKAKELKEMKDRVESQGAKSKLMQRAQTSFNAYIRARDAKHGCISCGTLKAVNGGYTGAGGWDAGHYRSRGASPELRFNEDNCFKQCVRCNRDSSGNVVNMRIGILKRIGQERLDAIEGPREPAKYTANDLREIAAKYKAKLKEINNNKNA